MHRGGHFAGTCRHCQVTGPSAELVLKKIFRLTTQCTKQALQKQCFTFWLQSKDSYTVCQPVVGRPIDPFPIFVSQNEDTACGGIITMEWGAWNQLWLKGTPTSYEHICILMKLVKTMVMYRVVWYTLIITHCYLFAVKATPMREKGGIQVQRICPCSSYVMCYVLHFQLSSLSRINDENLLTA